MAVVVNASGNNRSVAAGGGDAAALAAATEGMTGQNIICFAKDWNEDPTSCNHVLRNLAKNNKVVWVNSISTRSPNLASGRDLGKIARRLLAFTKGAQKVDDQMWLYNPLVLPFHHSPKVAALNRWILRTGLGMLRRQLGMRSFQLWTFVPTSAEYVGKLGEDLIVYYCTDEWSKFSSVDGQRVGKMVNLLAVRADVVFATSRPLVEKLRQFNPESHLASHGVNYESFARATGDRLAVPEDLAALPGPVLGFYGLIEDWLDQNLLAQLAERHPEWSIALVGRKCVDTSRLEKLPNVHFLGRKPHSELPAYCKGFDVALIPHQVNELTRHMNPIKLREYMSAGLPIVSTALPEMRHYPDHCAVAEDYDAFEAAVVAALRNDSPAERRRRSLAMQNETWERKVVELGSTVMRVKAAKAVSKPREARAK